MTDENVLPEDKGTGAPYGDFHDAARSRNWFLKHR